MDGSSCFWRFAILALDNQRNRTGTGADEEVLLLFYVFFLFRLEIKTK